jgi:TolA-binding protein
MNKSILVVFVVISIHINLFSAEPSAFGAGDLSSSSPYGLTSDEKLLLQNKRDLKRLISQSNNLDNSLKKRIDGLQSILESLSQNTHSNKLNLNKLNKRTTKKFQNVDEYEKRLSILIQDNAIQIKKLNLLTTELTKVVDSINRSYVEKKEFNKLVDNVNRFKSLVFKELKKANAKPKVNKLSEMPNTEIKIKAEKYYKKKYYTKSIEYYEYLVSKKYELAKCYYMLGEIYYYKKNYAEAMAYFKKSASLKNKASYLPVLMLHTAISMDRTGDKANAKVFYSAVITKYPKSSSAKIAHKKIKKIK